MVTLSLLALAAAQVQPTGQFSLDPARIPVADKLQITLTYTVGPGGMSAGDALRLDDPRFHGMRWAKWGFLSTNPADCSPFSGPTDGGSGALVTAETSIEGVTLSVSRNSNLPGLHSYAYTDVVIDEGQLSEGDTLRVRFGDDRGDPDCGLQTSLRSMSQVPWPAAERLGGAATFTDVIGPSFSFVVEGGPSQLLVSAPSEAIVGEVVTLRVAALDNLGNPTPGWFGSVIVEGQRHELTPQDGGVAVFELSFETEGVYRVQAIATGDLIARSNPIVVESEAPDRRVFWGDLHTHHGHAYRDGEGGVVDENHVYAREVAGLQFGCESLKASPHELDWEELWPQLQSTCQTHSEDDAYVAMLGFEWMGDQNSPGDEGHHNVYYNDCEGLLAPNTVTGLTDRDDALWVFMLETEAETGSRSLSIPHATAYTGYNWRDRDDALRPLAEIYSEWGDSSAMNGRGSGVYDGLAAGHRLGLMGASDNHDGWLGNRFAFKNVDGGFGAIVATDLSHAGLFEALSERSTYATTGIRPVLRFTVEDGGGVAMGEEYVAEAPRFSWRYVPESRVATLELLSLPVDGSASAVEVLLSETPDEVSDATGDYPLEWDGVDRAVWLHVVEVDGEEAWSSPIWLTADCGREGVLDPAERCEPDTGPDDSGTVGDSDAPVDDSGPQDSGVISEDKTCGCAARTGGGAGGAAWAVALLALMWRRRR